MENTDNQNTVNHIVLTKLFKSSFAGASGNKSGSCSAPKSLDFTGFLGRSFLYLALELTVHLLYNAQQKVVFFQRNTLLHALCG